jgi:hypothetical protein
VLRVQASDPLIISGLALRRGTHRRVLLTNLTPGPQSVAVLGLAGGWRLHCLDETTVKQATMEPEAFRAETGTALSVEGGRLQVVLPAYAVARLDRA